MTTPKSKDEFSEISPVEDPYDFMDNAPSNQQKSSEYRKIFCCMVSFLISLVVFVLIYVYRGLHSEIAHVTMQQYSLDFNGMTDDVNAFPAPVLSGFGTEDVIGCSEDMETAPYLQIVLSDYPTEILNAEEGKPLERKLELIETLKWNAKQSFVSSIYVLSPNRTSATLGVDDPKIHYVEIEGNPSLYSTRFKFANSLVGWKGLMNSDIRLCKEGFDKIERLGQPNDFYAVSRQDHPRCPFHNQCETYVGSHDVFLFHDPIPTNVVGKLDFPSYYWGSENVIIFEMEKTTFRISNPCYELLVFHIHCSQFKPQAAQNAPRINGNRSGTVLPKWLFRD